MVTSRNVTAKNEPEPKISKILAMFEPTILPIAICPLPKRAAAMETLNSGRDVPMAIKISPITSLGILNISAKREASTTVK